MKNYLVTGGLSSLVESYNNMIISRCYLIFYATSGSSMKSKVLKFESLAYLQSTENKCKNILWTLVSRFSALFVDYYDEFLMYLSISKK